MRLRQLLEKLSSVTGLTSEEKDPEEFLNSLLAQIMKAEPFLKVRFLETSFLVFFKISGLVCIAGSELLKVPRNMSSLDFRGDFVLNNVLSLED